jgi:chemotaxis protein methyltransferase CheR
VIGQLGDQAKRFDLDRFRAAIVQRIGLQFEDNRLGFLAEVLQRRLDKLGRSSDAYLRGMEADVPACEVNALARELTVGETYFFRNIEQFRALAEVALPERMQVERIPRTLRLLSAGCASGEEAYTLAIVARESIADAAWEVSIRAVDLNPGALEKAARGRYSSWALRETPADIQRKWFRADGRDMMLDEQIRSAVTFGPANLASEDGDVWQPALYDVIFCRNVLMYFSPDQMRAAIARMARSLAPGGFLFLGHAETLRGISDQFHLRHTHGTFYYALKTEGEPGYVPAVRWAPRSAPAPAVSVVGLGTEWFDSIRKASERVAALVPAAAEAEADAPARPAAAPAWDPAPAFDLLRRERFAEALDHVRVGSGAGGRDPDLLLLEAALLAHSGQTTAAEEVCRRLLLIDEFSAGAHYVIALCREQAGQADRAAEHYRVAAYLDPEFAMPRLHLGLLARRAGDREAARRELAQALVLLRREDASRLLLFGGGFNRDALIALAESALKECGGRP